MLKIAVMNNSGNVGKTTVCEMLLHPRIPDSEIISIETINSDSAGNYSAHDFMEITKKINLMNSVIIDVGASNIEIFSKQMEDYPDTQEYIDYFIIPVTPTNKQQHDSLKTIRNLILLGVENERIKIVFNRCGHNKNVKSEFSYVVSNEDFKKLNINNYPVIPESEVFYHLANTDKKFFSVLADQRDFRSLILASDDPLERAALAEERAIKGLAIRFTEHLNVAFEKLNLEL